jgi:NADPH-dependent curcumin reductase CurA
MKKIFSLTDYTLVGHLLKAGHIATLKALTVIANKSGKNKSAYLRLKAINDSLLQLRCDLELEMYRAFWPVHGEIKLRQRFLGTIDKKRLKKKDLFI